MYRLLCIIALCLLFACSSEKPSAVNEQRPQTGPVAQDSYFVEIKPLPLDATRRSTLYLTAQGFAPADAKIEWLVNGAPVVNQSPFQFSAAETKKGDSVQAKATIKGQVVLSNIVEIKNSPPVISKVRFVTDGLNHGEILGVEVAGEDIDGDNVSFTYEWTKNDEPAGSGRSIGGPLKKGDKLSVRITPYDGEAYGRPAILDREIQNMPPVIEYSNKFSFDGKVYTYQVKASDPDGNPLAYSLKSGPSGMTIDPSTGLVRWDVPEDFKGKAPFTVSVSDGQGGEASMKLSVEIKSERQ